MGDDNGLGTAQSRRRISIRFVGLVVLMPLAACGQRGDVAEVRRAERSDVFLRGPSYYKHHFQRH